ncbi:hypothetical protein [Deinococcus radiopugnans]|uniref:Uncharacterized protein n=1 Tax=Deinococcus radiopugnans ATCC 19172 TaxID=585398 RepID=A0A5C4Y6L4_9DEIO|nr:hypothetical protein [Deinococcus radiopugnans]MBB6017076.1 hypothetical protein [Deinococcus radiopugnans ATCC 19172]TNM70690.1 hypothetical protein FHR04_12380 [Deinococcus radiopugnans ATCC 19172]
MTLSLVQIGLVSLWLLAAIVTGVVAIMGFARTGRALGSLIISSVALTGSFLSFLWPKLGHWDFYAAFGLYPALVVAATALVLPLAGRLLLKRTANVD